jgi:hypothetical protein
MELARLIEVTLGRDPLPAHSPHLEFDAHASDNLFQGLVIPARVGSPLYASGIRRA